LRPERPLSIWLTLTIALERYKAENIAESATDSQQTRRGQVIFQTLAFPATPMIYLASQSPRRAELLRQIGVAFQSRPADIDETPLSGESPEDFVRRMSTEKAAAIHRQHPDRVVLGSDTAVVLDGHILGKPAGAEQAMQMLLALSGRSHRVLTGVALAHRRTDYALSESLVQFRTLSREEAQRYWASGEPVDKAGGYAIQGLGAVFIERIEGSYSGIMGLPLFETARLLRAAGVGSVV
jgi:septum formation protein